MASRLGIGAGIGIPFRNIASGGGKPYLSPEVKEALKAVVIAYGKTNNDSDRAVVKNLVDASNPFIISNAAYKLNSGYGKYEEDFTSWDRIDASTAEISNDGSKIKCINTILNVQYLFNSINKDIPSFKVKISNFTKGNIAYYYRKEDGTEAFLRIEPSPLDKVLELPKSYNTVEGGTGSRGGFYSSNINIGVTIEQIPSYQGAFVTDGVEDLITSTKTVQDMLGGSNEITVVSMIHQIELNSTHSKGFTNYIETIDSSTSYVRTQSNVAGKTGIYGYTYNNATQFLINNILGDKNDYEKSLANATNILSNSRFSVAGGINNTNTSSSVAWYWTVIANKVLTTDEINQVIAYYNLDRTLNPDILCDVKKQRITNENHAEFGDKLIDFSGNGRDIQLNNIAWNKDSGIGKYGMDFLEWKSNSGMNFTSTKLTSTKPNLSGGWLTFRNVSGLIPETKVKVSGAPREFVFIGNNNGTDDKFSVTINNGVYTIPEFTLSSASGFYINNNSGDWSNLVIEQIPSHAGALCFDGVEDYGKVTGLPIYKDYTVVADYVRTFAKENVQDAPILSKSQVAGDGAFLFNYLNVNSVISSYSFGTNNVLTNVSDSERKIYYQSKYVNGGKSINSGTGTDYDSMWLGTYRDDSQFFFTGAIYSLMTFPYSMSEFLIERQLKKHKLGTLYPDMVEWRPIYTSNVNDYTITKATYFDETGQHDLALGNHYPIGTRFRIYVKPSGAVDEVTSIKVNGVELTYNYIDSNYGYAFNGTLSSKSPQKIDITIDEYIRYEDIVQPYPAVVSLLVNGTYVKWGDKLKVGDKFKYLGGINLLPNLYSKVAGITFNGGDARYGDYYTIEKVMNFIPTVKTWNGSSYEPKVILSPERLNIPNSSLKILGYIPDLSGHGNHGVIHNSAYAEGSGVNEDGSYQFDGVDDFVTIPTLSSGGKQVLMKVNWQEISRISYDQRNGNTNTFAIYISEEGNTIAYNARNNGQTYIDGVLNSAIMASQLKDITHNITITNNNVTNTNTISPIIGRSYTKVLYSKMALYDFMLFDEISTDEEILTLNEYVGIEGNTDDLFN